MIFHRVSYRIAWQFTAFVFLLLVLNGIVFLAADLGNARRQAQFRLQESLRLMQKAEMSQGRLPRIPPMLREHLRLLDAEGNPLHTGDFFTDVPVSLTEGYDDVRVNGVLHRVVTQPILQGRRVVGYVQLADLERVQLSELPERIGLYLAVSILISIGTFWVGLFFAKRSLRPAQEMMEKLEQFTQDASHELRTPLTAARTSLELAELGKDVPAHVASAKREMETLTLLTERLLEMAHIDRFVLQKAQVDLSALVGEETEKQRAAMQKKHLKLETDIHPGVACMCDAPLVRLAVSNLLHNALKFTPSGGTVRVVLSKQMLCVEDTGQGIEAAAIAHIFDRFFQQDSSRTDTDRGYGLGLALVRRIIDAHGWSISVQSTVGTGTVFTIFLQKRRT